MGKDLQLSENDENLDCLDLVTAIIHLLAIFLTRKLAMAEVGGKSKATTVEGSFC